MTHIQQLRSICFLDDCQGLLQVFIILSHSTKWWCFSTRRKALMPIRNWEEDTEIPVCLRQLEHQIHLMEINFCYGTTISFLPDSKSASSCIVSWCDRGGIQLMMFENLKWTHYTYWNRLQSRFSIISGPRIRLTQKYISQVVTEIWCRGSIMGCYSIFQAPSHSEGQLPGPQTLYSFV